VLHADASITIRAPAERVWEVYTDYRGWPRVFPTIKGVRQLQGRGPSQVLEVDHVEGRVRNQLTLRPPDQVDLWEEKRRYDASFVNRFTTVPGGTRWTVAADIHLKGWARLLRPFLGAYVRRQIERLQLQPVKAAAERR
jgi:uncharacterized membrane protein